MSVLIVIPARMKATRLPNKPLAEIGGMPMIVQVMRRAEESGVGEVVVACDGEEIAHAVVTAGGRAVITDPDHPSGSDRIWEAVNKTGATADTIINLQGDVPTLEPRLLKELLQPMSNPAVDIATLAAPITRAEEHENPSVVKAVLSMLAAGRATSSHSPLRGSRNASSAFWWGVTILRKSPPTKMPKSILAPPQGGSGSPRRRCHQPSVAHSISPAPLHLMAKASATTISASMPIAARPSSGS
jgi:CTP:molybdopterin cytidylyltransferase MocA